MTASLDEYLPRFSPSLRVDAPSAKQDRILLELGDWRLQGSEDAVTDFYTFLGPYNPKTEAQKALITRNTTTPSRRDFGLMFNRPKGSGAEVRTVPLTRGKRNLADGHIPEGQLLIGGHLSVRNKHTVNGEREHLLRMKLQVNPTRFLVHQPCPAPDANPQYSLWGQHVILYSSNLRKPPREVAFDANDNVLLTQDSFAMASPETWPIHRLAYFLLIERELSQAFRKAAAAANNEIGTERCRIVRTKKTRYYNLNLVETYWEFSCDNAVDLLRQLEPKLISIGVESRSREYPVGFASMDWTKENLRCIDLVLPKNRQLRVYAKTHRRLRFEITHNLKTKNVVNALPGGRKVTQSLTTLMRWLNRLARDAAQCLNDVLGQLETEESEGMIDVESASPLELIADIIHCVGNRERALAILEILIERGGVAVGKKNASFLPEIKKLRRKGILKKSLGTDRPTDKYRNAWLSLKLAQEL